DVLVAERVENLEVVGGHTHGIAGRGRTDGEEAPRVGRYGLAGKRVGAVRRVHEYDAARRGVAIDRDGPLHGDAAGVLGPRVVDLVLGGQVYRGPSCVAL